MLNVKATFRLNFMPNCENILRTRIYLVFANNNKISAVARFEPRVVDFEYSPFSTEPLNLMKCKVNYNINLILTKLNFC